jgi:large subunit ribosomal protein L29
MARKTKARLDDLKAKSADQLKEELVKLKKEQFNLRFQAATGQLEKTPAFPKSAATLLACKTLMREKAQAGQA